MMKIRKCRACGRYTFEEQCCGTQTASGHPPKYGFEDRYAKYRRKEKGIE